MRHSHGLSRSRVGVVPRRSGPDRGLRSSIWRSGYAVGVILAAVMVAACESPAAPAACGPLPQVTVNVGETSSVTACFNDANGDVLTYTATSSNPSVATASLAGTSITVTAIAPGNTTVTVTASDPGGLQGQTSFAVMVPNRSPQPRGTMPNLTVQAGRTATVDASQYFTEPDGQALTYRASSSDAAVVAVSVSGSMVTVSALEQGSATITVAATDPGGLTANQSFAATVPNRAPVVARPIPDRTVHLGETATLDASAHFTDPDGDPLRYTASSSNPAVAVVSVSGSTVTITGTRAGSATTTVTARDPGGLSATQTFGVTVTTPAPDLAFTDVSPATATATPGTSVTFTFRIRNQGTVPSAATTIRAVRSPNPIISARDAEIASYAFAALGAKAERAFPLTISIDARSAAGTIYIGMCVDAVPGESDTRNNCSDGARLTIAASSTGRGQVAGQQTGIRIRAYGPSEEPDGDR